MPFSFTVTAQNPDGTTDTGYTGTVQFTSYDGAATLPANYTFATAGNGTHTFTNGATLDTIGNQAITATDTTTSGIAGTSGNIAVKAQTTISTHSTVVGSFVAGTVTFSATLTSQTTGHGLPGQTITFTVTGPFAFLLSHKSCSATTNSAGIAMCSLPTMNLGLLFLSPRYMAAFGGSTDYLASNTTGKINVLAALL